MSNLFNCLKRKFSDNEEEKGGDNAEGVVSKNVSLDEANSFELLPRHEYLGASKPGLGQVRAGAPGGRFRQKVAC